MVVRATRRDPRRCRRKFGNYPDEVAFRSAAHPESCRTNASLNVIVVRSRLRPFCASARVRRPIAAQFQ
jgi:hypothetical protein